VRWGAADWTLASWMVAAFLGGVVGTHYLLRLLLAAGSEMAPGMSSGWLLL
jgi:hypothetical protein